MFNVFIEAARLAAMISLMFHAPVHAPSSMNCFVAHAKFLLSMQFKKRISIHSNFSVHGVLYSMHILTFLHVSQLVHMHGV